MTVIQGELLTPVQAQPLVVVTEVVNGPPAADAVCELDEREKPQVPLWVTVNV